MQAPVKAYWCSVSLIRIQLTPSRPGTARNFAASGRPVAGVDAKATPPFVLT
jgi:hypothetical protein